MSHAPSRPQTPPSKPRAPLPSVRTDLGDSQIIERLAKASRRGKLAGFHERFPPGISGTLGFWLDVFGQYFDRRLLVRAQAASPRPGATPENPASPARLLCFENRVKPFRIWAFWVICVLSVWPGVLLVHSMMATYFGWYPRDLWITCAWYLPVSALPVPLMWRTAWKKSEAVADAEARQTIARIAQHLGATLESPGEPGSDHEQDRASP